MSTTVSEVMPSLSGSARNWVVGRCWLYCRRQKITVSWIGPVWSSGAQAPLFACSDCLVELDTLVQEYLAMKDESHEPPPPPG
ncbi:hypothetical protein ACFXBB_01105 [Streptomyces scopuliridis]|uniref:hypothetical protein n=1 Tax=Streptomyces scopuliridis TaxID=452529 RepID=UPI0036AC8622